VQISGRDTALPCPVFHFPEANKKDFFKLTAENAEGAEKEKREKLII
jgi:hypothetical protein